MKLSRLALLATCASLLSFAVASAQGSCPNDIFLALSRAYAVCRDGARNTLCYGSGALESTLYTDAVFAQPGDSVPAGQMQRLTLHGDPAAAWGIAFLRLQANLPLLEERAVTLLLFGEAAVENLVPPVPEMTITARANINLRALPEATADIIERAQIGSVLIANGRTADNAWVRARIPNQDRSGWVSTETLAESDFSSLVVADPAEIPRRPFESFTLQTGMGDALCDGAPQSGALLQTPNDKDEVMLTVNGVQLRLTGTAFLQAAAGETMTVSVLDGLARVGVQGASFVVPAGARLRIPLDADMLPGMPAEAEPYAVDDLPEAPLNFLDIRLRIRPALTPAELEAAIEAALATPAPEPTTTPTAVGCVRMVESNRNLRRGPGTEYPVVGTLEANAAVYPIGQTTTAAGDVWWKLSEYRWMRANDVREVGPCTPLPEAAFITLPTRNTLALETCAPTNGPLRPGQEVTLVFTPPSWELLDEAQLATYHDRGSIQVGDQRLSVQVSNPTLIDENQYIRRFTATWRAQPGSYRIAGRHLAYEIICQVTVAAGE